MINENIDQGIKIAPAPNIGNASIRLITIENISGYLTFNPRERNKFYAINSSKKHIVTKINWALKYEPKTDKMSRFILYILFNHDIGNWCSKNLTISFLSRLINRVDKIVIDV